MMNLAELQAQFHAAVTGTDESFLGRIDPGGRIGPGRRLSIYAEAYRLRLTEVLGDNYPGLRALAGAPAFEGIARGYIEAHPSRFRSVRWYGDRMAEYLESAGDIERREALVDMARADWAVGLAFDAADAPCVRVEDMAAFAPERWGGLGFVPVPSLTRLDLRFNTLPARETLRDGGVADLHESDRPRPWVVWRQGLDVRFRSMEADEAWALDAARNGSDFADLCAGLTARLDESSAASRAAALLKGWLVDGMIARIADTGSGANNP